MARLRVVQLASLRSTCKEQRVCPTMIRKRCGAKERTEPRENNRASESAKDKRRVLRTLELFVGPKMSGLAQVESERFNNKRCKFLWSQGLVSKHVHALLALTRSFAAGPVKLLKAFIRA